MPQSVDDNAKPAGKLYLPRRDCYALWQHSGGSVPSFPAAREFVFLYGNVCLELHSK